MVVVSKSGLNSELDRVKEIVKEEEEEHKKIEGELIKEDKGKLVDEVNYYIDKHGKKRKGFYLDGYLRNNLLDIYKAVVKKWDGVGLITGMEGSGKSNNGWALCKFLDPTFPGDIKEDGNGIHRKVDRIVFTQKQFEEAVQNAKPLQAILWDEMVLGGLAEDAGSQAQRSLIKFMTTIRKKRLFIIFVIPYIFMLRRYFAVARSRFLIHCYSPDGNNRGYFNFYNYDKKRQIVMKGYKEWETTIVKPNFYGRFVDYENFFFDDKDYQQKKDEAILSLTFDEVEKKDKKVGVKGTEYKNQRDLLILSVDKIRRCIHNGNEVADNIQAKKVFDAKVTNDDFKDAINKLKGNIK